MTATGLDISQALLSHYQTGAREPGLDFVARICDYYDVTADYLLGRSASPESGGSHCTESYKQSKHNNTTGFYCESWHLSFNGS